ncbi:MAG: hypothetical protein ACREL7_08760 [Longimicrobiales bacterium]
MKQRMIVCLAALSMACASSGGRTAGNSDVIRAEELVTVRVSTAYEIVERLRPAFLRGRGQTSLSSDSQFPVVYVDGMRQGGLDSLRRVAAQDVGEIRYLTARDATTRYGTGHPAGVIEVVTRR